MNELKIKNKIIELFPEAYEFTIESMNNPLVVSCWINNRKISSLQLEEIRKVASEYSLDFIFNLDKYANEIRLNVNFKGLKN